MSQDYSNNENEISNQSESLEELIISDENDSNINHSKLLVIQSIFNAYIFQYPISLDGNRFTINIPSKYLPLSLQYVYGLFTIENIFSISFELDNDSWIKRPKYLEIIRSSNDKNFIGKALVTQTFNFFFSTNYIPKFSYKSSSYLLTPEGTYNNEYLINLVNSGYDENKARIALILFHNNLENVLLFLKTGQCPEIETPIPISYSECPILYLFLEICDIYLNLTDICCICGDKLFDSGLKPTICSKSLCSFSFTQLGIGTSIIQEIKRDLFTADLLISVFCCALNTKYLKPCPSWLIPTNHSNSLKLLNSLPKLSDLIDQCSDDISLLKLYGQDTIDLLRWILLSNRSQFLSLPKDLSLKEVSSKTIQFMALISTPEKENEFRKLEAKYGSRFLFHGSHIDRWHSIIRNGLINASGTELQRNGAAHGSGIYFAPLSSTSIGYSGFGNNLFNSSYFSQEKFSILGVCQVANDPTLLNHNWCLTLTNEKACVVRFLLINYKDNQWDISIKSPQFIPQLENLLKYYSEKNKF